MKLILTEIHKSLNKAYLKQDLHRLQIDTFKSNLKVLFSKIDNAEKQKEHEEHYKNIVSDFLKDTYYKKDYDININKRKDLVIRNGKSTSDSVGVIIEAKRPSNEIEMISKKAPNAKALHELLHYYMQERFINDNKELKHLIATNSYDWYIFDAANFERFFYDNKKLRKSYEDWNNGVLVGSNTNWFYDEVAKPYIDQELKELEVVHFNLLDYKKIIENSKIEDDNLINLYKILSPEHLLKRPFANDSNTLNKEFYNELLHIIGLEEKPYGGKKLIDRKDKNRDEGSLLENIIQVFESHNRLVKLRVNPHDDEKPEDDMFSIALELCITWLNRILFLKLLEGQLIKYHSGNPDYLFVNSKNIKNFKELDELFFDVLAKNTNERSKSVIEKYGKIPYLNSSLFEPSDLEQKYLFISSLKDRYELPLYAHSVLKNKEANKHLEKKNTLHYLFEFLDAYNFSSDSSAKIQEDNKTIINASVLGLIFEKINGYKDGSFFTPGFITMYMCSETIRRAVAQKFKELENKDIENFENVKNYCARYFKKEDIVRFNIHIDSLKICDPAVGSGHFLVSALNEIIAIKSELNILIDSKGIPLEYEVTVDNDELTILSKKTNKPFEYLLGADNKPPKEIQQIQVTLFEEKRKIIENCLFGVDINPKSVLICRLRLWIELLKNAYYKVSPPLKGGDKGVVELELETLPNIDINIKCGNSLISRFPIDYSLSKALKSIKYGIKEYKEFIKLYIHATNKEEKHGYLKIINAIKEDFKIDIDRNNPKVQKYNKLSNRLYNLFTGNILFEPQANYENEKKRDEEQQKLVDEINKIKSQIDEERNAEIYKSAFEWRFEFPEVLDYNGDFVGFDLITGNPPYGVKFSSTEKSKLANLYLANDDIYSMFLETGLKLSKNTGYISFIIPIFWLTGEKYFTTRKVVRDNAHLEIGITLPYDIFVDAYVDTGIYLFSKIKKQEKSFVYEFEPRAKVDYNILNSITFTVINSNEWSTSQDLKMIFNPLSRSLIKKLNAFTTKIENVTDSIRGILANQEDYSTTFQNGYEPVFIGKLDRYFIENENLHFIKYGSNLKEKPLSFDYFVGERILIRRIISRQFRIMASISNKRFVTKKDIYVFKPNQTKFSANYLLAIINSKLISFIKTRSSASAKKDDFTQLTLNDIRQIGVPEPKGKQLKIIEELVKKILNLKNQKTDIDTTALESKIDQLVYKLYGLTPEEIEIIEGA